MTQQTVSVLIQHTETAVAVLVADPHEDHARWTYLARPERVSSREVDGAYTPRVKEAPSDWGAVVATPTCRVLSIASDQRVHGGLPDEVTHRTR
jgi:hypothetical protein